MGWQSDTNDSDTRNPSDTRNATDTSVLQQAMTLKATGITLQATGHDTVTTDHYSTSPQLERTLMLQKVVTKGRTLVYKRPLQKNVR